MSENPRICEFCRWMVCYPLGQGFCRALPKAEDRNRDDPACSLYEEKNDSES